MILQRWWFAAEYVPRVMLCMPCRWFFFSDRLLHSSRELQPHVEAKSRLAFSIVSTTVISTRKFLCRAQVCENRFDSELLGQMRWLDKQSSDAKHVANKVLASCKKSVDGRNKSQSDFAPVFQRNQAIILRSGAGLTPRASATLLRINFARCRAKDVGADSNVVLKSNLQRLPGFLRKQGSCREWPQLCSIAWCLC